PFVAKGERAANTQAVNRAAVSRQALNEFFTRDLTEFFVEMDQERRVDAEGFDYAQFLGQRIDQRRIAVGRDDRIGVAIKRDGHGDALVLAGVFNRLSNDLLMAEVDAVEHADGYRGSARTGFQFARLGNDVHALFCGTE